MKFLFAKSATFLLCVFIVYRFLLLLRFSLDTRSPLLSPRSLSFSHATCSARKKSVFWRGKLLLFLGGSFLFLFILLWVTRRHIVLGVAKT